MTDPRPAPTVLIVDDELALVAVLAAFLAQEGYAVRTAPNGAEALAAIVADPPEMVLLDMAMPIMDGETLARELRTRGIAVPLIVMTAARDARRWAEAIGAPAYVPKPVSFPALLARLDQVAASA